MSLNLTKFTEDMNKIASLDDQPALTSAQLKAKFDEGGVAVKTYLNDTLTSEVESQVATDIASCLSTAKGYTDTKVAGISLTAGNVSYDNTSSGMTATKVQGAIDELKTGLSSASSTADSKIKYSDFAFSTVTSSVTLAPAGKKSGTISLSKTGYYPLGVIGDSMTEEFIDVKYIRITERGIGTGTLSYRAMNADYGNTRTGTMSFDILWVKVS